VPVHGFAGIWGTISLGLFACGKYGSTGPVSADNSAPLKGLFYGGGTQVLLAQVIGSAVITAATFGVAMAVMLAVNAMGTLRLSPEGELYGMDLHEHGISAYPEYEISPFAAPSGLSVQTEAASKANAFESKAMARTSLGRATS
jgi:ammonium transporter, Amt family